MNKGMTVSNSSPLIALTQIDQLELLRQLFEEIIVPPAVLRETSPTLPDLPVWLKPVPITPDSLSIPFHNRLGGGEREAITLAVEQKATWIILDDLPARRAATILQLRVIGTIGIFLAAHRRNLITSLRSQLDALLEHGFHLSDELYERVLREIGELPA